MINFLFFRTIHHLNQDAQGEAGIPSSSSEPSQSSWRFTSTPGRHPGLSGGNLWDVTLVDDDQYFQDTTISCNKLLLALAFPLFDRIFQGDQDSIEVCLFITCQQTNILFPGFLVHNATV